MNKKKMSTIIFGRAAFFFQCRMMNVRIPLRPGDEFGILLRQKMQRSLPERQTERKDRCLRLPRHTGNPQLKYGKASATIAWKTKSTRTPSLVCPFEKTGDLRFAPNLLPYTGVRAVFFGVTCTVVRKVYRRMRIHWNVWKHRNTSYSCVTHGVFWMKKTSIAMWVRCKMAFEELFCEGKRRK